MPWSMPGCWLTIELIVERRPQSGEGFLRLGRPEQHPRERVDLYRGRRWFRPPHGRAACLP
jgi:hypothetical protein